MLPFRIASSRLVPVMVLLLLALMFAVIDPHSVAHAMNCPGTPLPCYYSCSRSPPAAAIGDGGHCVSGARRPHAPAARWRSDIMWRERSPPC
jgi:hypothetical protein